jgi:hypothetical protein
VPRLAVLDDVRGALLRTLMRVRPLRRVFVDPALRIPVAGVIAVAIAFVLAAWQPLVSLWLGAALFGVPHVLAGVRHVGVREGVTPLTRVACLGALVVGVAQLAGAGDGAVRLYVALFAVAVGAELGGRGAPAIVLGAAVAMISPRATLVALAHLHGLSSVAYVAVRARRRGVPAWPLLLATGLVLVGGATGAFDRLWMPTLYAPRSAAASIVAEAAGSIGWNPSAIVLRRALFLYAFGQALHFAVWLRLVPDVDRPSPVPHTFGRALALLEHDFGRWARPVIVLCIAAAPLILVGGGSAREAYFALTYFHVGLEAAGLAKQLSRERSACSAASRTWRARTPRLARA